MSAEIEALARMARVAPPGELDALVRGRYRAVVLERRCRARGRVTASAHAPRPRLAASVPLAERCAYVLGLLAYGAQASGFAAHWVWHVLTAGR